MRSLAVRTGSIQLPLITGKHSMLPFNLITLRGLPEEFQGIAQQLLKEVKHRVGTGFFTIHGRPLLKNETLRRGGPHTDGNYEEFSISWGGGGGGGWKVGETGPEVGSDLHHRQYVKSTGGIVLASNHAACRGWFGEYEETPGRGGDCSHLELNEPFMLLKNQIYYGNNHFIHESLPMDMDVHRVFVRITMPETHVYSA